MFSFQRRLSWQWLVSVLVVMLLAMVAPDARAASTDNTVHGVRLASPAVVRIITTIEGQVICHNCASGGSTITFPGQDTVLGQDGYYWVFRSGSGALISHDGYVLTADHVVDIQPNDPSIQAVLLQEAIQDYAKTHGISQARSTQLFELHQDQLSYSYQATRQQVFLSTAYTGPLRTHELTSYDVTRIVVHSLPQQQDTAIIKVEGNDLPYLLLASASSINVQDSVTAIAFPADAELSSFVDLMDPSRSPLAELTQLLTPTVEDGQVTAKKPLSDGTLVYETSNIAGPGSSGGPVINSRGQIIGFIDGSRDQRVIFLVPSEVIASYVRQAGMPLQAGAFMSLWTTAINEYDASWACHWTRASQDLKQLSEKYQQFGGVHPFLEQSQAKATPSECPLPPPPVLTAKWPLLAGLGAIVILVGTGLLLFAFPRRKKATLQAAATTTSTSTGARPVSVPVQDDIADRSEQAGGIASSTQVSPMPSELAPSIRKCSSGHVVTLETAHFCPECGAPIEEPKERKVLQGQTYTLNGHD